MSLVCQASPSEIYSSSSMQNTVLPPASFKSLFQMSAMTIVNLASCLLKQSTTTMSQFHAMHARTGCLGADAAIQRFKRRKWRSWAHLDVCRVVQNLSRTEQLL